MDGYRQSLLGRALADTLHDLEQTGNIDGVGGDLLFSLFDEAMRLELRDGKKRPFEPLEDKQIFTHNSMELTGQVTAFNRFMDDWSVQTRVTSNDVKLDHGVIDLHLPRQHQGEQEQEREMAMRLKLRRQK